MRTYEQEKVALYRHQDEILAKLESNPGKLTQRKLCGGTALARAYLHHRISYDLDFFFPTPFDPLAFSRELHEAGLTFEVQEMTRVGSQEARANQWHGVVFAEGKKEPIKVSAIEDAYWDVYPGCQVRLESGKETTSEGIDGLYHRKLLTIAHPGHPGKAVGGRQKARDLFDLWVLTTQYKKLDDFMALVPYGYPKSSFMAGLDQMDWFGVSQDLAETLARPGLEEGLDIERVRRDLYLGVGIDLEAEWEKAVEANLKEASLKEVSKGPVKARMGK